MRAGIWAMDRSRWLWLGMGYFLMLETLWHIKAGSVFILATAWIVVHQWLLARDFLPHPSDDSGERIMIALYYGLIIAIAVFVVFSTLDAITRSINSDFLFFRLE